ncbi:MAG: winged helix-turn-helix transcriptional regulator [Asgard group archaeon]|nr:winged helix-turn-helix transcriptional regulator [Asgard group archaeon]
MNRIKKNSMRSIKEYSTVIYENEIRSLIVRLLAMYNELSLPQLSDIMDMKKTTIQYHLKILRDNDIIYSSRDSHEDSRGSIPTKYYKLKQIRPDYHVRFDDLKKISDSEQRIEAYNNFLLSLESGLRELITIISFAKEGILSSKRKINDLYEGKLTSEKLDELHKSISEVNIQYSTISIPKEVYSKIKNYDIDFCKQIAKINEDYMNEEISSLKKLNLKDKEISDKLQNDEKYIEGYEIITVLLPLKNLIDVQINNKKQKKITQFR